MTLLLLVSTSVWTVFSASNYPDHTGLNEGAVLKFAADSSGGGGLRQPQVLRYVTEEPSYDASARSSSGEVSSLAALVHSHRYRLRHAFEKVAAETTAKNRVTVSSWARTMGEVLRLEKVNWLALQPALAPSIQRLVPTAEGGRELVDSDTVNYKRFLDEMEQAHAAALLHNTSDESHMTQEQHVSTLGGLCAQLFSSIVENPSWPLIGPLFANRAVQT